MYATFFTEKFYHANSECDVHIFEKSSSSQRTNWLLGLNTQIDCSKYMHVIITFAYAMEQFWFENYHQIKDVVFFENFLFFNFLLMKLQG